jgi:hypothetical protein
MYLFWNQAGMIKALQEEAHEALLSQILHQKLL